VVEAMTRQNLQRITAVLDETREAIRQALQRGIATGQHPREVARRLRAVVGLNVRQAAAVESFEARLVAQGRDPAQVARMAGRYANRQLKVRTETVARTEVMTALHAGKRAQWDRAVREGVIQASEWDTEFVTANDERVCPQCGPLDGTRAPIGQTPLGQEPPLHPRCRCLRRAVLRGFREGEPTSPVRQAILARR
jgi:SPP1 gp7 family putative phage head morphogenesis protein